MKVILFLFFPVLLSAQNEIDRILKGGEIIVNGLTLLKKDKTQEKKIDTKIIESICIQNKMENKITFSINGKDDFGNEVNKELIVQQGGKECVFELTKGIYGYKIVLPTNEVYRQGEYKFEDELTIIVK